MIKILDKVRIEGNYLKIIKAVYEKPTANSILKSESKSFTFKSSNKTGMPTLITSIQHSTGSPNQSSEARKRKVIEIERRKMISVHK